MEARERREWINRLAVLLTSSLRWYYLTSFRGQSWQLAIRKKQRRQLQRLLKDNPSLNARLEEFIADAYDDSVLPAAKETGLEESALPTQCTYTEDSLLNNGILSGIGILNPPWKQQTS